MFEVTRWWLLLGCLGCAPRGSCGDVPKILWQLVPDASRVTDAFMRQQNRTAENNPGWRVEVVDDGWVESFVARELDDMLQNAYRSMNPAIGAARADFARYALLWKYGGVYLDADCCVARSLDSWIRDEGGLQVIYEPIAWPYTNISLSGPTDPTRAIIRGTSLVEEHMKREHMFYGSWTDSEEALPLTIAQWFIASKPKHVVLRATLERLAWNYMSWQDTPDTFALGTRYKVVYSVHRQLLPGGLIVIVVVAGPLPHGSGSLQLRLEKPLHS